MSVNKKNRSLWGSRSEAQRIYYQRQTIKRLEQENNQLKEQLKTKHEGFMASIDQNCEYATILIELRSWLEAMARIYEDEYKDVDVAEHYKSVLSKLNELEEDKNENNRI